jgi:hypothetical protein
MIMTEDKARKIAIRQRMAETGEPYSVARHAVEGEHASSADPLQGAAEDAGAAEAQARPREQAEQARQLAEQARTRAEQAERLAEEAEEAADSAEEAADEAENLADDSEGWHHRPSRPSNPPRPPRPPHPSRGRHYGPHGQDDWPQQRPDPAERLQERVDQFIQRLSVARDQADRLISAAERIFTPARSETARSEPVHPEPPSGEPESAGPA